MALLAALTLAGCGGDEAPEASAPSAQPSASPSSAPEPSPSPSPSPSEAPSPSTGPSSPTATSSEDSEVLESGWSFIFDREFAVWGAVVRNNTAEWTALSVTATALDAMGEPVDTGSPVTVVAPPNSVVPLGGPFDEVRGMTDIVVETSVTGTRDGLADLTGAVTVTGTVRGTDQDSALSFTAQNGLAFDIEDGSSLTAVFRNAAGKVIGGGDTFVPGGITAGSGKKFAINTGGAFIAPAGTVKVEAAIPFDEFNLAN